MLAFKILQKRRSRFVAGLEWMLLVRLGWCLLLRYHGSCDIIHCFKYIIIHWFKIYIYIKCVQSVRIRVLVCLRNLSCIWNLIRSVCVVWPAKDGAKLIKSVHHPQIRYFVRTICTCKFMILFRRSHVDVVIQVWHSSRFRCRISDVCSIVCSRYYTIVFRRRRIPFSSNRVEHMQSIATKVFQVEFCVDHSVQ